MACLSIDETRDQFHRELTLLSAREVILLPVRMARCTGCGFRRIWPGFKAGGQHGSFERR